MFSLKKYFNPVNPCAVELLFLFLILFKQELLTQFPASNDEKYLYLSKIDSSNIELLDNLSIGSAFLAWTHRVRVPARS